MLQKSVMQRPTKHEMSALLCSEELDKELLTTFWIVFIHLTVQSYAVLLQPKPINFSRVKLEQEFCIELYCNFPK